MNYDFIVIGGGAAGCALAAALAKRGTTLLLERGKSKEEEPLTQTQAGWPAVLVGSATDRQRVKGGGWAFIGNVLGGGTAINAGVFLKEPDGHFFNEHPHFRKSEVSQSYENISRVSFERKLSPVSKTIVEAMTGAGIGKFHHSVDVPLDGIFSPYSLFDSKGNRHSAAALLPREGDDGFDNLSIRTQCLVTRILFSHEERVPRAAGVEYLDLKTGPAGSATKVFVKSGGEVIVCAGAIHSPKILMLSGIGDPGHLEKLNIKPVVTNPDVGLHLMDQPGLPMMVHCHQAVEKTLVDIAAVTDQIHFEQVSGGNILTCLAPVVLALLPMRARTEKNKKRLEKIFGALSPRIKNGFDRAITVVAILKHPITKGSVRLRSNDPQDTLDIDSPKLLHEPERETMIAALQALKKIFESTPMKEARRDQWSTGSRFGLIQLARTYAALMRLPMAPYRKNSAVTFPPLPDLDFEDQEVEKKNKVSRWLNMMCIEGWHYVGTCQFGKVVNEDFAVIGVNGLRVVDASVLKRPPTINPQATLMMMGDYAGRLSIRAGKREPETTAAPKSTPEKHPTPAAKVS